MGRRTERKGQELFRGWAVVENSQRLRSVTGARYLDLRSVAAKRSSSLSLRNQFRRDSCEFHLEFESSKFRFDQWCIEGFSKDVTV